MNSIQQFVNDQKTFTLSILLNAFVRICITHINNGFITFDDIRNAVSTVSTENELQDEEILIYSGLLYESIAVPIMALKGPQLGIKGALIGNEKAFLSTVLQTVDKFQRLNGSTSLTFVELKKESVRFLNWKADKGDLPTSLSTPTNTSTDSSYLREGLTSSSMSTAGTTLASIPSVVGSPDEVSEISPSPTDNSNTVPGNTLYHPHNGLNGQQSVLDNYVEHSDPINRFLAHIRKSGMDILFPQVTHDMVSCAFSFWFFFIF
jgi:hypothetical protein